MTCSGDTDCGSDGEDERGDAGYMSGAESDSGLVDARQSMNLVVRNLQVRLRRLFSPLTHPSLEVTHVEWFMN